MMDSITAGEFGCLDQLKSVTLGGKINQGLDSVHGDNFPTRSRAKRYSLLNMLCLQAFVLLPLTSVSAVALWVKSPTPLWLVGTWAVAMTTASQRQNGASDQVSYGL